MELPLTGKNASLKEKELNSLDTHLLDGLKLLAEKVKAVKECAAPKSIEEVQSFLGMAGNLDNFINNYPTRAAPLSQLTGKDAKFH